MVRETRMTVDNLIYPLFLVDGKKIKKEIKSLPGNYRWSLDLLLGEIEECMELGLRNLSVQLGWSRWTGQKRINCQ